MACERALGGVLSDRSLWLEPRQSQYFAGERSTRQEDPESCGPNGCKAATRLAHASAEEQPLPLVERDPLVGSWVKGFRTRGDP